MEEFKEIGHCGMQFKVQVRTVENKQQYSVGIQSSKPNAASIIGIFALPNGIPVGLMKLGGIGQSFGKAPYPNSLSIFLGSDSLGKFGHECPECKGYWRSNGASPLYPLTCPYCGLRASGHHFLTKPQIKYIEACCDLVTSALGELEDGERTIEMDQISDSVTGAEPKPSFYYSETSQQKRFNCSACNGFNDILGRYGYCSACGTYNAYDELLQDLSAIEKNLEQGYYDGCVRGAVAAFDSYARNVVKQFIVKIPMTPLRKTELERKKFHNLSSSSSLIEKCFDIKLLKGFKENDSSFLTLMFQRRHVYEHNGGEVDDKYLKDSGDTSVRLKQRISETYASASRTIQLVKCLGQNLHEGFHLIFPPEEKPIEFHREYLKRMKGKQS